MNKSNAYFFDSTFKQDLAWNDFSKIRVGSVHPNNREQISKGLKDLSHESIRNRFLGTKKEFSSTELEYLSNVDGTNHYAIGIEEREKPFRGVAVVRLVRSTVDSSQAEIAITIIDDYQGIGLGTLLIRMIALAAAERSITKLFFYFSSSKRGNY